MTSVISQSVVVRDESHGIVVRYVLGMLFDEIYESAVSFQQGGNTELIPVTAGHRLRMVAGISYTAIVNPE